MFRNQSVAITGANGMIASALAVLIHAGSVANGFDCKKLILISRSWENSAIANLAGKPNVEAHENRNINKIKLPQIIFHMASPSNVTKYNDFEELMAANLQIVNLLVSKDTNQVIYISSGEVYGKGNTEEEVTLPKFDDGAFRSLYPMAKIVTEELLLELSDQFGFEAKLVRLFHTFGPGVKADDGRSFADILWGAIKLGRITLKSSGSQIRSFLYITDAVEALLQVMNQNYIQGNKINVGSEIQNSILEFATVASKLARSPIEFEEGIASNFKHSPNQIIIPKIEKLKLLGWQQQVSVEEGIQRTLEWIKKN